MSAESVSIILEGALALFGNLFFRRKILLLGTGGIQCQLGGRRYVIESPSAFYDSKEVVIQSRQIFWLRNGARHAVGEGTRQRILSFLQDWFMRKKIVLVVE